jgi:hypothetical protein
MDLATLLRGGATGRGDPYANEKSMFGIRSRGPAPIPWNQLSSPGPAPIPWDQFSGSGPAPGPAPGPIPWDMLSDGRPRPPHSLTPPPRAPAPPPPAPVPAAATNQPQPPHSRTPLAVLPPAGGDPNAPNWWETKTSGGASDTGMSGLMGLLKLLYGGTA